MLVLIQHTIMLIFKWFSFIFCYEFKISNSQNQLLSLPSFRVQSRNLPYTLLFLAPFTKGFPFSAITHTALYRCARKIEGFARDDDTGIALSKHIRCTLREINLFPLYRHFERSEKSSLHSTFSCSFHKRFPLFRCRTQDAIPVCRKDPSASLGMTLREWCFPNISVVRYLK